MLLYYKRHIPKVWYIRKKLLEKWHGLGFLIIFHYRRLRIYASYASCYFITQMMQSVTKNIGETIPNSGPLILGLSNDHFIYAKENLQEDQSQCQSHKKVHSHQHHHHTPPPFSAFCHCSRIVPSKLLSHLFLNLLNYFFFVISPLQKKVYIERKAYINCIIGKHIGYIINNRYQ